MIIINPVLCILCLNMFSGVCVCVSVCDCVCGWLCLCVWLCVCVCVCVCVVLVHACVLVHAPLPLLRIHIGIRIHHNHRPYETCLKRVEWSFDTRIKSLLAGGKVVVLLWCRLYTASIFIYIFYGAWSCVQPIK